VMLTGPISDMSPLLPTGYRLGFKDASGRFL
jgi:hypothetical protein